MDYLELATACFAHNVGLNRLHVTADGTCFPIKSDGVIHARTLNDASMKVYERQGETIVEVLPKSQAETIEANTAPLDPHDAFKQRFDEQFGSSAQAYLIGQQRELDNLELKVQNAQTIDEVDSLVAGQTNIDLLAVAHARRLFLQTK